MKPTLYFGAAEPFRLIGRGACTRAIFELYLEERTTTTTLKPSTLPHTQITMSRFFTGDSSSDSDSEEESLYSDQEEEKKPVKAAESDSDSSSEEDDDDDSGSDDSSDDGSATGVNRFLRSDDEEESSEEEEERSTVVKSAKDKKFEELEGTVRLVENAEKIGDWTVISAGMLAQTAQGLLCD